VLDSLADFVNFGVAPAVLIHLWSLHWLRNLGWIVSLGLAVCCALRLARFNVAIDDPDKPADKTAVAVAFAAIPAPATPDFGRFTAFANLFRRKISKNEHVGGREGGEASRPLIFYSGLKSLS
jgi:hypothetical protein